MVERSVSEGDPPVIGGHLHPEDQPYEGVNKTPIIPTTGVNTTIIVPSFNEEHGLPVVLRKICAATDDDYEIIVVDDGSSDRTSEVARQFPCRVVTHRTNKGKGQALITGIAHAGGKNIIWIDADDTYPADAISDITRLLSNGTDLVYTSRAIGRNNIPRFNRIGNALFHLAARWIYGFTPSDPCSGLCGVRKECLEAMELESRGFGIECEIAAKAGRLGLRMADLPIAYRPRIGMTKLNGIVDGFDILFLTLFKFSLWTPTGRLSALSTRRSAGQRLRLLAMVPKLPSDPPEEVG